MKKAILYLLLFAAVQLTIGLSLPVICKLWFPSVDATSAVPLLIATAVIDIILLAVFLGFKMCPVSRNYVRTRPWLTFFWTVVMALGIIIPLTWLEELIPAAWRVDSLGATLADMLKQGEAGYFVICMLTPLMEEVVFRGALIRALQQGFAGRKNAVWLSVLVSALVFSGIHCNLAQMPHAFIVGMILGWLFVKTNSIVPGCIVHWINNSAAFIASSFFPQIPVDSDLIAYFGGNQMAVYEAVIFSLMIALPAFYQLTLILNRPSNRI